MKNPARLRIAVLSRNFSAAAGGAERYAIALVEQLAARHEFHVFAQTMDHPWPGVIYHRISMPLRRPRWINQLWFAAATWRATSGTAGERFDVVHSHENTGHGDVQTVHVLPVTYTLFNNRAGLMRAFRWLKVFTSPRLMAYLWLEHVRYTPRRGRAVVVISPSLKEIFCRTFPRATGMTSLIMPGITPPATPVTAGMRHAAREQLGLPQHAVCLLFVGNDFRKKGLQALIAAMARLPDQTVLAVAGTSTQLPHFQRQAEQAGVQSRIFFLGALTDVAPAYRAADCLVHPTLEDTFAMVVLEAMAHGLPAVVSGVSYCGISGMLQDGVNAIILDDPRNDKALATTLNVLLEDAPLRAELGRQARVFSENFQWDKIAAEQEKLYLSVAASKAN